MVYATLTKKNGRNFVPSQNRIKKKEFRCWTSNWDNGRTIECLCVGSLFRGFFPMWGWQRYEHVFIQTYFKVIKWSCANNWSMKFMRKSPNNNGEHRATARPQQQQQQQKKWTHIVHISSHSGECSSVNIPFKRVKNILSYTSSCKLTAAGSLNIESGEKSWAVNTTILVPWAAIAAFAVCAMLIFDDIWLQIWWKNRLELCNREN